MKINVKQWHTRLYLWWYRNKYHHQKYGNSTNLCPYVRAVIFWAPLRAVLWNWVELFKVKNFAFTLNMIAIPALAIIVPKLLGYFSYNWKMASWVVVAIATAAIICASIIMAIGTWIYGVLWRRRLARGDRPPKPPSKFFELLKEYGRSFHDRVCPEIEIEGLPTDSCDYYGDDDPFNI